MGPLRFWVIEYRIANGLQPYACLPGSAGARLAECQQYKPVPNGAGHSCAYQEAVR